MSAAKGLSVSDNAKLFAMLSMATADSQIVVFAEKYRHPHWRPITAIRAGVSADGGNALLERDAKWEPLIGTPPHPEYPSAHAAFSGAAEVVLRAWLGGDDVEVSVTSPPLFGLTRTYRRLSQISEEVEELRGCGAASTFAAPSTTAPSWAARSERLSCAISRPGAHSGQRDRAQRLRPRATHWRL